MLAIIRTGGKQYKIEEGNRIKVEKLSGEEGSEVVFQDVLFLGDENKVRVGNPNLEGIVVRGKIVKTAKAKKVVGIKHKSKKRYKVKFGHRQTYTEVEIIKIA